MTGTNSLVQLGRAQNGPADIFPQERLLAENEALPVSMRYVMLLTVHADPQFFLSQALTMYIPRLMYPLIISKFHSFTLLLYNSAAVKAACIRTYCRDILFRLPCHYTEVAGLGP
jgi:hypothetical protein